ncbi:MAG: membrane protein insertase YidC [Bacteroides sp.]|nr:membrane protein insertase YidC [Bacteroides sp.]MCM1412971.1 membrane protein insertase YidC [Bacteroides sp.]MCM1471677.1 membrane protein insertase YidC [Bacteroides sp.]
MNKNTLTGLLLMGAIIMVFTYLNRPSQAELEAAEKQRQDQAAADSLKSQPPVETINAFSPQALADLQATVRRDGSLDTTAHAYTLTGADVTVNLSADSAASLSGEVKVGSYTVPVTDIVNASYGNIPVDVRRQALDKLNAAVESATRYKGFARYLSGSDSSTVTLANDKVRLTIASKGGVISQAELLDKKYDKYGGGQVCPIANGDDMYGFCLAAGDVEYDTRNFYFELVQESDSTVLAKVNPGDGVMLGLRYTLQKGAYTVKMDLVQENMQSLVATSKSSIDFHWDQMMARNEAGRMFESDNSGIYYMKANGDVDNLDEHSDDESTIEEPLEWVAFKNQFFSSVLISEKGFNRPIHLTSAVLKDDPKFVKKMSMTATTDYNSALETPTSFVFYVGPNLYPLLSDLSDTIIPGKDLKLTDLIPLGWALFRWINIWIVIPVFTFLGQFISNYGIIILLLTLFIKLILFPFTYKSYMSQAKMRVLAPEIKEINEKYPGNENAMKRQQETMALYSRAGANPMSGCLPMLLQLPILIAMFRFFPSAIELRGESFLWATDLSAPDAIIPLPFSIPKLGDKLSLFCLLMTAVNIIYTRINMQNQPGGMSSPAMKWMMYLMPVMFLVFFNNYAAGLSYYYLLSLLITIIQTYIFRRVVNEEKVRATMKANAAKPKKKSGFMARLEEAQRRQQAALREQEKQRSKKNGRR